MPFCKSCQTANAFHELINDLCHRCTAKKLEQTEKEHTYQAAVQMDWRQVVLNGGPPCFHLEADGRFCGRAERWEGHGPGKKDIHKFVSLADLIAQRPAKADLLEALGALATALTELEAHQQNPYCEIGIIGRIDIDGLKQTLLRLSGV